MKGGWGFCAAVLATSSATPLSAQCPDGSPPPCRGPAPAQTSIAVLYFTNLSRDSADAYLADGLTEEIATSLSRVGRLVVKSPSAVRGAQRATPNDLGAIGRRLAVRYVVEGAIQPGRDRIRVRVRLVNTTSGVLVWSDAYSRPASDLLAIQEDIAQEVATNVRGALLPFERATLARHPTTNTSAYDHYLRGNFLLAMRSPVNFQRALQEYHTALRLDPGFSRARARIAYGYALASDWGWPIPDVPRDSVVVEGMKLADAVIAADSNDPDGWMARGYLLQFRDPHSHAGAREAFARAVRLDSTNAEAWHQYSSNLAKLGEDSLAAIGFARTLALDPSREITMLEFSFLEGRLRHFDAAVQLTDSAIAVSPGSGFGLSTRAGLNLLRGDTAAALADAARAEVSAGVDARFVRGTVAALRGDSAAARTLLAPLAAFVDSLRLHAESYPSPVQASMTFVPALLAVGDRERALTLLEHVRPRGARLWIWLRWASCDPLRAEPRFQALVTATNPSLPEGN